MEAPIKAAKVSKSFGPNMEPRWVVMIDPDAVEILGLSRSRFLYAAEIPARVHAEMLQARLDEAYTDAMTDA